MQNEAEMISIQSFFERHWSLSRLDGTPIAEDLQLKQNGHIGGARHHELSLWRIEDGQIVMLDGNGRLVTRFGKTTVDVEGRLNLSGRCAFGGTIVLREHQPAVQTSVDLELPKRRNLVVMRAGDNGLFGSWQKSHYRNWDFAVSFYGGTTPAWEHEYFSRQKGPKWQPIHTWLTGNTYVLDQYDYFWFPDDDIMTDWANVNALFDTCRQYNLLLAQPALTKESYRCHEVTTENSECLIRFTTFVEGMVPVFRSDALRLCLPVMQEESRFGWGHDWVFPKLLGYPRTGVAIVDNCSVTHTRPAGINTDIAVAERQKVEVIEKYGAEFMDHRVRGAIFRKPLQGHFEQ